LNGDKEDACRKEAEFCEEIFVDELHEMEFLGLSRKANIFKYAEGDCVF
jgi:hypothetical protein